MLVGVAIPMELRNVVHLSQARLFALYFFSLSGVEGFYAKLAKMQFWPSMFSMPLSSIVLIAGLSADSVMNSSKAACGLQWITGSMFWQYSSGRSIEFWKGGFEYVIEVHIGHLLGVCEGIPPRKNVLISDLLRSFLVFLGWNCKSGQPAAKPGCCVWSLQN